MDKPAEILVFDYLQEQIDAAAPEDVLFSLELHDTIYQTITEAKGIRVSDSVGVMAPEAGGGIREFDVQLELVAYARVEGQNKKERQPALTAVWEIQQEIFRVLLADGTLGGRVCDVLISHGMRGYTEMDAKAYAVANIPIVVNPSGARLQGAF